MSTFDHGRRRPPFIHMFPVLPDRSLFRRNNSLKLGDYRKHTAYGAWKSVIGSAT